MHNHSLDSRFHFLAALLAGAFLSCSPVDRTWESEQVVARLMPVDSTWESDAGLEAMLGPYVNRVNEELQEVLTWAPIAYDKRSEALQNPMSHVFARALMTQCADLYTQRTGSKIDIFFMTAGGIRSIISQGPVTLRDVYAVMPFENSAVVLEVPGRVVLEMARYFASRPLAHPQLGLTMTVDLEKQVAVNVQVNGKPVDTLRTYHILTTDYHANGGDYADFFLDKITQHDLDYKLRNVLADFFSSLDTLPIIHDVFVTETKQP